MTILLTGASGLVGSAVARVASAAGHTVIGITASHTGPIPGLARRLTLDLAAPDALRTMIRSLLPDVIINAAAVSEPAACEAEPGQSYALNVSLPASLARAAGPLGLRLIHLSSEQVFDGEAPPYAVTAPVRPLNLYGRQKVESERIVAQEGGPLALSVRAPLLNGNSPRGKRSVHERLLADWTAGRTARLFVDEIRQVCHADNLAAALVELASRPDITGIVHWAGAEPCSRHELGIRIREHFGLSEAEAPITAVRRTDEPPTVVAKRAADLSLSLDPLAGLLKTRPQTLAEQLVSLERPRLA